MNKNFLKRVMIVCLLATGYYAYAQKDIGSNAFSLEEALQLASENNREILKGLAEVEAAKAGNMMANAAFLPAVELSSGYSTSNDPLYAFGFKLQQQGVTMADFDPAVINSPGRTNHFATQVMVEQPLINIDAWMGKSAAANQLKATE
ncbi:MAG: TolC family protein, partial [Chlorobiales bacterium]|nr:TolC family protein [Chlorobiales bacterium]